ncbi:MAG: Cellulosome-anchoring protein precursor, partial [Planctomycetota bacterium]
MRPSSGRVALWGFNMNKTTNSGSSTGFRTLAGLSSLVFGAAFIATLGGASSAAFAQDECIDATEIQLGVPVSFEFTPTTPTASAGIPTDAQCSNSSLLWTFATQDLWYRFTAPYSGLATFDTCSPDPFNYADTSLVLYEGSDCSSMVQVACNGDYYGPNPAPQGCASTSARIASFPVIEGTVYYLRVGRIENPDVTITSQLGTLSATIVRIAGWGNGQFGELHVPPTAEVPARIDGGARHVMSLREDGVVIAWGDNTSGQATVPSGLGTILEISAGSSHSLALRANGTVAGWGSDTSGRASGGASLTDAISIAAGNAHSLAARATGEVFAWGSNSSGQATVPPGLTGVTQVEAGNAHSVALRSNGSVAAWGANTSGQSSVPADLAGVSKVSSNCVGNHTLALRADGTVVAWGLNTNGQSTVPTTLVDVRDIAAGGAHSLALLTDGTIVGWGRNELGQATAPSGHFDLPIGAGSLFSLALGDLCPDDPNKTIPGVCGCGVPDIDTDSDGVLDCNDECPTDPTLIARVVYYADNDQDTFGSPTNTTAVCAHEPPTGYVTNSDDCDDNLLLYADGDGDGFGAGAAVACGVALNTDCNDGDVAINPAAIEVCDAENVDENCNGQADNADAGADATTKTLFYVDADSDGYSIDSTAAFCDL